MPTLGGIAALHLGKREGKDMRYVGKAGTGFSMKVSADLRRSLDAIETPKSQLTGPKKPKARWVEPPLIAEVEYRDVTADGYLRHPTFKGLSEDLSTSFIPDVSRHAIMAASIQPRTTFFCRSS